MRHQRTIDWAFVHSLGSFNNAASRLKINKSILSRNFRRFYDVNPTKWFNGKYSPPTKSGFTSTDEAIIESKKQTKRLSSNKGKEAKDDTLPVSDEGKIIENLFPKSQKSENKIPDGELPWVANLPQRCHAPTIWRSFQGITEACALLQLSMDQFNDRCKKRCGLTPLACQSLWHTHQKTLVIGTQVKAAFEGNASLLNWLGKQYAGQGDDKAAVDAMLAVPRTIVISGGDNNLLKEENERLAARIKELEDKSK
jgi:hypothetical protein